MNFSMLASSVLATAMLGAPLAAANQTCAAMNHVVKTARNDFTALRSLKMQPGSCAFRASEYKCRWAFPGDAFAVAEAQAAAMLECAAAETDAAPVKLKRGATLLSLEPDLSLVIAKPEIDDGRWVILIRIVAGAAPAS